MTDRSRLRLVVLGVLVISLVATLLGRLWYLQVLNAHAYGVAAQHNQTRDIVTQPPRGEVLDDMGRPLIDNKTALVVSVDRTALERQPDGGVAVLHRLSKLLNTPYKRLHHEIQQCGLAANGKTITRPCWAGSPYQPIPVSQLKPNVASTMRALQIEELSEDYPGVSAQLAPVRNYPKPDGALASTVLGYLTPISSAALAKLSPHQQTIQRGTEVGATGLEASYQKYLRGKPGVKEITVDALGGQTGVRKNTPSTPGDDVVTNLDAKAQADLETQLRDAITAARSQGYAAPYDAGVVMNVRTGGIVAMGSNPTYQPNHAPPTLTRHQYKKLLHASGSPLFDKAYAGSGPPGSTFKMISSSGLIQDGTMSVGGTYPCATTFQGRHSFEGATGLGNITLEHALIVSCDTYFFQLGFDDWRTDNNLIKAHQKPREGVQKMARDYGLGENPDVDLPGAAYGHIPDRVNARLDWQQLHKAYCAGMNNPSFSAQHRADDRDFCLHGAEFRAGDQENEDVGQGAVTVSPLQLAVAYSALANGGTVYEPRVAKAVLSPTGKVIRRLRAPVRDHIPLSQANQAYIRTALYGVTSSTNPPGTAAGVFANFPMSQVQVGGKTGTAELSGTNQNGSWFASFGGPTGQKPQYVTVIEVNKSHEGAINAAPAAKGMFDDLYGLQGAKAIFANGMPPKLRTAVAAVVAAATGHAKSGHAKSGKGASAKNTSGKSSSGNPTSGTTTPPATAAGLPPALPVFPRREPFE